MSVFSNYKCMNFSDMAKTVGSLPTLAHAVQFCFSSILGRRCIINLPCDAASINFPFVFIKGERMTQNTLEF